MKRRRGSRRLPGPAREPRAPRSWPLRSWPAKLALAILGTPWVSPRAFERAVRRYAWRHFRESLTVHCGDVPRHAARFTDGRYSAGATATEAIARAFVRRWVAYRLDQRPLARGPSAALAAA